MNDDLLLVKLSYGTNTARWVSNKEYQFWNGLETETVLPILDDSFSFGYGLENVEQRIYQTTLSRLRLIDPEGLADDFRAIDWYGHEITVYEGKVTDDFESLVATNKSINGGITSHDDINITFEVLPYSEKLNRNIQHLYYTDEANESFNYYPYPLCFGLNLNVQARVLEDEVFETPSWDFRCIKYQLNDGFAPVHKINYVLSGSRAVYEGVGYNTPLLKRMRAGLNLHDPDAPLLDPNGVFTVYQYFFNKPGHEIIVVKFVKTSGTVVPVFGNFVTFSNGFIGRFLEEFTLSNETYLIMTKENAVAFPQINDTFLENGGAYGGTATAAGYEDNNFYEKTDLFAGDVRFWVEGHSATQGVNRVDQVLTPLLNRIVPPQEIDSIKLVQLYQQLPLDIGTYIDSKETVIEAIAKIFPAGVILGYSNTATPMLEIQTLKNPEFTAHNKIENIKKGSLKLVRKSKAAWRVIVAGLWNHSPISSSFENGNVYGAALTGNVRRDEAQYQARRAAFDLTILGNQKVPHELYFESRIQDVDHLQFYADFLFNLYKVARSTYAVTAIGQNHVFKVGDTVNISDERYPFNGENGKNSIIIKVIERPGMNETELRLWH